MKKTLLGSLSVLTLISVNATAGLAGEPLKVGVLATLEGTYTVKGEDGIRGLKTALAQHGMMAGDREIELVILSTDASPDSALRGARKLVEQDGVEIVLGPLSGSEGIAIRDYFKTPAADHIHQRYFRRDGDNI
jgi:ABC-type branched-subunit amino acid transport system substrate-binding protein